MGPGSLLVFILISLNMNRIHLVGFGMIIFCLIVIGDSIHLIAQPVTLGWTGTELIPTSTFSNPANWTSNVPNPELGDMTTVTASGDTLTLNWVFGTGNRYKWAQCYLYLAEPISLDEYDLFGINLRGLPAIGDVGFELKFEDGAHQAVIHWDRLALLDRWADRISVSKKQFENASTVDWSTIRVISFAVYAQASAGYTGYDQGSVSICNLIGARMQGWERATTQEFIDPQEYVAVKENAIQALIDRQQPTGLLTTWTEDGSSWLYGQGLALKALSLEGNWNSGIPVDDAAIAAENLALFLAANQQQEGYWPRAWNSKTGSINVLKEADGTIWMGDFPWIITGLQAYFKKSGDTQVIPAIELGLQFLHNLIQSDGKFFTTNPENGAKYPVTSCEAYAAAILALFESGDTSLANSMISYISTYGWDAQLRMWREGTYSDRIVLFANTWMSYYQLNHGELQKGLDALTIAGKVMYNTGNGVSFGLDGIVPLAIWNEGTLSYIADGGPGSKSLFNELVNFIHPDGMIAHYNENLGTMGGIWAVDWHSLDGTSWLYFVSSGKSPFDPADGIPYGIAANPVSEDESYFAIYNLTAGNILIRPLKPCHDEIYIRYILPDGRLLQEKEFPPDSPDITLSYPSFTSGPAFLVVQIICGSQIESFLFLTPVGN